MRNILTRFIEEVCNAGDIDAAASYKDRLRLSRASFPDQRFSIQLLVAEGNTAVITWLLSAMHRAAPSACLAQRYTTSTVLA